MLFDQRTHFNALSPEAIITWVVEVVPVQWRITEPSPEVVRAIAPYGTLHKKMHAEGKLWGWGEIAKNAMQDPTNPVRSRCTESHVT